MEPKVLEQFDSLIEKFTELLIGDTNQEKVEKLKLWAIYSHIHKTMPALTAHWSQEHPEARQAMKALFEEVRDLNQTMRNSQTTN